jgi:sugar/nucleoside kinase (ribokinase family)
MLSRRVQVFGPAYLDRVLRVDGPILGPSLGPPLDQSTDATWKFTSSRGIDVIDPTGYTLAIAVPDDWPGPYGEVRLSSIIRAGAEGRRSLRGLKWHDDLGGMGAGFAAALNGTLVCALGPPDDVTSVAISKRLDEHAIPNNAIRIAEHPADWTLLISSGEFGDKLPIGFRGCHAAIEPAALAALAEGACDLRVVASLPNELAARVLKVPGAGVRLFAPAMRNMLDRDYPMGRFAASIDFLCCNRIEWETLEDREEVGWQVSILVVTDGPRGSMVRYTNPTGDSGLLSVPAFPRRLPPRDTNRAGEAFGATFIASLLDQGWNAASGVVEEDLIRLAATRASAAAALVLDRVEFGFPSAAEVDVALMNGRV